jgi:N-methylhydantoinase A
MATAIKEITIERGRDVRDFALFVFGGGGPLHGIDLARSFGFPKVVIPPEPGNFSALACSLLMHAVDDAQSFLLDADALTPETLAANIQEMKSRVQVTLKQDFSRRYGRVRPSGRDALQGPKAFAAHSLQRQ